MSFSRQGNSIYHIKVGDLRKKINSSLNTHSINLRFCRFLCIMISYLCVKFQRLTSFDKKDIQIYIKVGNPRTKKLIVLGILTQSKKRRVHFLVS